MRAPIAPVVVLAVAFALALGQQAAAHLPHDRPHIQSQELRRTPQASVDGVHARYDLQLSADPFEDLVRHEIDAHTGTFRAEYRRQPSEAQSAFVTEWSLGRMVEYRDINSNGLYEPNVDTVVKAWPFSSYTWSVTGPRGVNYSSTTGPVASQDIVWFGTLRNGPTMKIETDAAGDLFEDEGARVLPQDMIVYLDVTQFPPRGLGDLFAFDGNVTLSPGAALDPDRIDANTSAGLVARIPQRLAGLDWGAQATLDRVEQNVNVTLGDPQADGSRPLRIHFPLFDRSLHMTFVSALEYVNPAKRGTDAVGPVFGISLFAVLSLARRR